jgi:hypothetical protein
MEIGRFLIQGQPKQKVSNILISTNKKLGMVVYTCHPSYLGSIYRRITAQAGTVINIRPYPKYNKANGTKE